jgi:hypothetical protein
MSKPSVSANKQVHAYERLAKEDRLSARLSDEGARQG